MTSVISTSHISCLLPKVTVGTGFAAPIWLRSLLAPSSSFPGLQFQFFFLRYLSQLVCPALPLLAASAKSIYNLPLELLSRPSSQAPLPFETFPRFLLHDSGALRFLCACSPLLLTSPQLVRPHVHELLAHLDPVFACGLNVEVRPPLHRPRALPCLGSTGLGLLEEESWRTARVASFRPEGVSHLLPCWAPHCARCTRREVPVGDRTPPQLSFLTERPVRLLHAFCPQALRARYSSSARAWSLTTCVHVSVPTMSTSTPRTTLAWMKTISPVGTFPKTKPLSTNHLSTTSFTTLVLCASAPPD